MRDLRLGTAMTDLLTFENLGNLLMLCFLQAVLGIDKPELHQHQKPTRTIAQQPTLWR